MFNIIKQMNHRNGGYKYRQRRTGLIDINLVYKANQKPSSLNIANQARNSAERFYMNKMHNSLHPIVKKFKDQRDRNQGEAYEAE